MSEKETHVSRDSRGYLLSEGEPVFGRTDYYEEGFCAEHFNCFTISEDEAKRIRLHLPMNSKARILEIRHETPRK